MLARQVGVVRGCRRRNRRLPAGPPVASKSSSAVEPRDRAAGDVPHLVAAGARRVEAGRRQDARGLRQVAELEPVELDVLPGGELAVFAAELHGDLPDRAELGWGQEAARRLHPQHEEPGFRLVVVQAVPFEPHQVLLRDRLVAPGREERQLVQDVERRFLELEPLDRVPPQYVLSGDRFRHSAPRSRKKKKARGSSHPGLTGSRRRSVSDNTGARRVRSVRYARSNLTAPRAGTPRLRERQQHIRANQALACIIVHVYTGGRAGVSTGASRTAREFSPGDRLASCVAPLPDPPPQASLSGRR